MSAKLGLSGKLYRLTAGTRAAWPVSGAPANLASLDNVTDVTLSLETGEADVSTRSSNGWKATLPTLKEATIDFESVWDTSDPGFAALSNAYFNNTPIALAVLDGSKDVVGIQGL